jgi:hypothetical protein
MCNGALGFPFVCQLALGFCQATVVGPIMAEGGNFNIYDVRKKCEGPLCYDFQYLDDYMARPDVREGLGVAADARWSECDPDVNARLLPDFLKRYERLVGGRGGREWEVRLFRRALDRSPFPPLSQLRPQRGHAARRRQSARAHLRGAKRFHLQLVW